MKRFLLFFIVLIVGFLATNAQKTDFLTDERDGQKYEIMLFGEHWWMTENMNFVTEKGSWCYNNEAENCAIYGKLYDWKTASEVCPAGWRLPSNDDWYSLIEHLGGKDKAGCNMKKREGGLWKCTMKEPTQTICFNALPNGYFLEGTTFELKGTNAYWWSSTDYDLGYYWVYGLDCGFPGIYKFDYDQQAGFGVRCVKDAD